MTEPVEDPVRLFRAALPTRAYEALDMTAQAVVDVHAAIAAGWTPEALAEHVSYHAIGLDNADQVMRHRLHKVAHPATDETRI
jgi:hypothetical protein